MDDHTIHIPHFDTLWAAKEGHALQDSQAMDDLWIPVPREAMPLMMQPVDFFAALVPRLR